MAADGWHRAGCDFFRGDWCANGDGLGRSYALINKLAAANLRQRPESLMLERVTQTIAKLNLPIYL